MDRESSRGYYVRRYTAISGSQLKRMGPYSVDTFLGFADAVVGGAFLALFGWLSLWWKRRSLRLFWKGYDGKIAIMATEYRVSDPDSPAPGENPSEIDFESYQDVAARATSRLFMSTGMARSVSLLWSHFEKQWRASVQVISDKVDVVPSDCRNLIVLGNPTNNDYLQHFLPLFSLEYPLLSEFRWRLSANGIVLSLPDRTRLIPSIDDEQSGIDYALVARFPLPSAERARIVIIAGSNMWGTQGASEFLLSQNALKALPDPARMPNCAVAFVLQIRAYRGHSDAVTLYKDSDGTPMLFNLGLAQDAT